MNAIVHIRESATVVTGLLTDLSTGLPTRMLGKTALLTGMVLETGLSTGLRLVYLRQSDRPRNGGQAIWHQTGHKCNRNAGDKPVNVATCETNRSRY